MAAVRRLTAGRRAIIHSEWPKRSDRESREGEQNRAERVLLRGRGNE